jgi:hypothetical protein
MLQLINYDYSLLYTYNKGITAKKQWIGIMVSSLNPFVERAEQQAISKKAGKKAGGLLSGGGGGATNKVAKVS